MSTGWITKNARRVPPAAQRAKRFGFPTFDRHRLDNGLEVYLAAYPRGPLVHLSLILPGGGQLDPVESAGLASLTASM